MVRILLLIDDYRELVFLQTLLKKTGFDVDGSQNERKFEDLKLTLNPELIICSSKGKNINGLQLAEKVKRHNGIPRFLLVVPQIMAQKVHGLKLKNVDAIIDSPIDAKKMLVTIAKACELDAESLIEKYNKIILNLDTDNDEDMHVLRMDQLSNEVFDNDRSFDGDIAESRSSTTNVSGAPDIQLNPSSISDDDRKARMQKALDELDTPKHDGFPTDVVHKVNRKLRKEEDAIENLEELEDERQQFVKTLFKSSNR